MVDVDQRTVVTTRGVSKKMQEIQKYKNTSSGVPIKIMTLGLFALTGWFAFDLYQKKRFPHQNGWALAHAPGPPNGHALTHLLPSCAGFG